jgi:post-segregation antitoxin (ccd killing protein)
MNSKPLNNKGISPLILLILIFTLLSVAAGIYYLYISNTSKNDNTLTEETKKITETVIKNWECDNNLYKCQTIQKINEDRKNNNLPEFMVNKDLCEAAREIAINISFTEEDKNKNETRKKEFEKFQEINSKIFKQTRILSSYPLIGYMREKVWPVWERGENINLYPEEKIIKEALELTNTTDICIAHPIEGPIFEYKGESYKFYTPTTVLLMGERR